MANLTKTSWSKGWVPSQDDVNGSPDALLRMDNLRQNEDGVLALVRGNQKLNASQFSDYVSKIFSKIINSIEYIWVALNDSTVDVRRSGNNFTSSTSILTNGGNKACFGDALGQVLICAGSQRKKDNGTTVTNLGIITPLGPPGVTVQSQPELVLDTDISEWTSDMGHDFSAHIFEGAGVYVDPKTLFGSVLLNLPTETDTLHIGDGPGDNPDKDTFRFICTLHDNTLFNRINVQIVLTDPVDHSRSSTDYYWKDFFVQGNTQFLQGIDQDSLISCTRDQFTREGSRSDIDWTLVNTIIFIAYATADTFFGINIVRFNGGVKGQLYGFYEWTQVDINDNGTYIAKSPLSPAAPIKLVKNGYVTLTPNHTDDPQVTHHWFYRRSIPSITAIGVLAPDIPDLLDRWYRVAVSTVNTPVDDTISDNDAIQDEDISTLVNENLQSLQDTSDIIGMEGLYNGRMLYLTRDRILLSDYLNPDAIDLRFTIKAFGDPTEKNLFLRKITNNQLVLATTKDLYEIIGSLVDLPDGTIDADVFSVGEKYPPLSKDHALVDGKLFYLAADGLRVTTGSNSINISPQLSLLFQAEDRHGVPSVAIYADDQTDYPMCVGHNNLYVTLILRDLTRRLLVYDLIKETYRLQYMDPLAIWATQTERVLLGFGNGGDNFIREFEKGNDIDGSSGQIIFFQTIYDANGQTRNRKDTFTLKIVADTGGVDIDVYLAKDKGSFTKIKTINNNGSTTFYIDLSAYALGFRYAIQLQGAALKTFFLYEITIEYDPRPEQVNFLRIPNTNMGSYARKRWTSFAFVIDTLGNAVTFTPFVDNTAKSTSSITKATKLTNIHFFTAETLGTDIGGTLETSDGSPFEFYGVNLEETVSEKLPTPCKYLVIPSNDYGSPNRKRHTSYKFQINTRGANVTFTPKIDGTTYTPATYNTAEKRTVEYFFDTTLDITGIDIGGILESVSDTLEFEFYGIIVPQQVEVLPPRLESLYAPHTNFGVAARKRLRTIPIVIDTRGSDVTFTPVVDGVNGTPITLNSTRKQTLYHYFTTDVFCTDFGGIFTGVSPFEFYEFGTPENVEILPVPKKYDQLPVLRFDKIGKLFGFRIRIIPVDATLTWAVYETSQAVFPAYSGTPVISGTLTVVPDVDDVYEIQLPKSVNVNIVRIVLGPTTNPFHRYDLIARVSPSGVETDAQWITVR